MTLKVPRGYEKYKKEYIKKLEKGETEELEAKRKGLFYVA